MCLIWTPLKGLLKVNFLTNTQHVQDLHVLWWGVFLGSIYDLHATVLSLRPSACRFMLLWHVQWERFTHMEQVDYSDLLDWCWSCVCKCQIVNGHSEWWFAVQNSSKLMSVCCFCCMNDLVLVQTCTVQILWKMNLDQYLWHSPKCCSINLA